MKSDPLFLFVTIGIQSFLPFILDSSYVVFNKIFRPNNNLIWYHSNAMFRGNSAARTTVTKSYETDGHESQTIIIISESPSGCDRIRWMPSTKLLSIIILAGMPNVRMPIQWLFCRRCQPEKRAHNRTYLTNTYPHNQWVNIGMWYPNTLTRWWWICAREGGGRNVRTKFVKLPRKHDMIDEHTHTHTRMCILE